MNDGIVAKVAVLQEKTDNLEGDVTEMRSDIKDVRSDIKDLGDKLHTRISDTSKELDKKMGDNHKDVNAKIEKGFDGVTQSFTDITTKLESVVAYKNKAKGALNMTYIYIYLGVAILGLIVSVVLSYG